MPSVLPVLGNGIRGVAVNEKQLTERVRTMFNRPHVVVEHRRGYGWFICERGRTMYGFHRKKLLLEYLANAEMRGFLYTPTVRETFGHD